jgi:hypothetical protein
MTMDAASDREIAWQIVAQLSEAQQAHKFVPSTAVCRSASLT